MASFESSSIRSESQPTDITQLLLNRALRFLKGDIYKTGIKLLENLRLCGILVPPESEMEGFFRETSNTKLIWVEEVLKLDLNADNRLHDARQFSDKLKEMLI